MEPINYSSQLQDVGSGFLQGIPSGLGLVQNIQQMKMQGEQQALAEQQRQLALQAQAQKQVQEEAKIAKLNELIPRLNKRNGNAQDWLEYSNLVSPEQFKAVSTAVNEMEDDQQKNLMLSFGEAFSALNSGQTELGIDMLKSYSEAYKNAGDNMAASRLLALSKVAEQSPEQARSMIGGILPAFPGGKDVMQSILDQGAASGEVAKTSAETQKLLAEVNKLKIETDLAKISEKFKREGKLAPDELAKAEDDLRNEYNKSPVVQTLQTVKNAYGRVQASDPNGTGDIGMIFSYMKMLDPTSTVREGEFATAQQSGGVPSLVVNMYNKAVSGEMLTKSQRDQMKSQAKKYFDSSLESEKVVRNGIVKIAKNRGIPTENLFYEESVNPIGSSPKPTASTTPSISTTGDAKKKIVEGDF